MLGSNFKIKGSGLAIIIGGLFISFIHFIFAHILAIYFGIGMSPKGAWFLHNVYAQPGAFIETLLYKYGVVHNGRYILQINFIFYWAFFSSVFYFLKLIKMKMNSSNNIK